MSYVTSMIYWLSKDALVERVMNRLVEEGWALKLSKCEFSVNKLVWLGYEIDENGYAPNFQK